MIRWLELVNRQGLLKHDHGPVVLFQLLVAETEIFNAVALLILQTHPQCNRHSHVVYHNRVIVPANRRVENSQVSCRILQSHLISSVACKRLCFFGQPNRLTVSIHTLEATREQQKHPNSRVARVLLGRLTAQLFRNLKDFIDVHSIQLLPSLLRKQGSDFVYQTLLLCRVRRRLLCHS